MSAAAPARRAPLEPGETVAERYVVRRVLGQGGMGQVLEVEHAALGKPFALKVLRLERWNDELVRRFNREARALARISTPHVAQVTDFGIDAQIGPFYVMELLEGETLEQRLQRSGPVPIAEAIEIVAELCEALAAVHAAGIVHRDLKPSNVGLPRSGPVRVKLLDFGLAAAMDEAFLSRITQSQQILGSLPYMAPEQFNAAEPAATMDIYATGVLLYEAITGRLPFNAPSTAALIHQILCTPPPALPSELGPSAGLVSALLERLLAKEVPHRFPSAIAAAQALREARARLGSGLSHPRTREIPGEMPATAEARAVSASDAIGHLPTMAMAETPPPSESGMRVASSQQASFVAHGPTHPHPPPSFMPSSVAAQVAPAVNPWLVRLGLAGAIGFLFAAVTAVAVVVVLKAVDTAPTAPSAAPVAPVPSFQPMPVTTQVATQAQAQPLPEPPRTSPEPPPIGPGGIDPFGIDPGRTEPTRAEPAASELPRPSRPEARPRPSHPEPVVAPLVRPLPPATSQPQQGDPSWQGGVIRNY